MCGRFALITDGRTVAEQFGAEVPFDLAPRYNIAPSQPLLVVREAQGGRLVDHLDWGLLPAWSKDAGAARRPINARAETVGENRRFAMLIAAVAALCRPVATMNGSNRLKVNSRCISTRGNPR